MGLISEETIEEVKQRADIVDVVGFFTPTIRKGRDFWCCCPFHKEKTPSCKLNQERQGYYCFGCKDHGNVISFVEKMVNTDFPGAIRWLADRYGIQVVEKNNSSLPPSEYQRLKSIREKRQQLLDDAADWYHSLLQRNEALCARNYLDSRGLDLTAIEKFKLGFSLDGWDNIIKWGNAKGYSEEDLIATGMVIKNQEKKRCYDRFRNRLMFPIWNELGHVVAFSARILEKDDKTAKYVNSPETDFFQKGHILYGFNFARNNLKDFGCAMICEGQLDVIACHRAGLTNAVASEGTAFTSDHARLLRKSTDKILLSFDADTAGYHAAERSIRLLHEVGFTVSIVTLPEGEDPDSIFRKGGADALKQVMSVAEPAIPYLFRIACLEADVNEPQGKSIIANRVFQGIIPIQDAIVKTAHCQWLAKQLGLQENLVLSTLQSLENRMKQEKQEKQQISNDFQPIPTFKVAPDTPPSQDQCWGMLLDLMLHYENFAKKVVFMEDIMSAIPNSPVGQAVSRLAYLTEQDEWEQAIEQIPTLPIIDDQLVGKAIYASDWTDSPSQDIATHALEDCLKKVHLQILNDKISALNQRMAQETSDEVRRKLYVQIATLIRQKKQR